MSVSNGRWMRGWTIGILMGVALAGCGPRAVPDCPASTPIAESPEANGAPSGEAGEVETEEAPVAISDTVLGDDAPPVFGRYAWLERFGPWKLGSDEAWREAPAEALDAARQVLVVEEGSDAARVVLEDGALRLALYVRSGDLAETITERVFLGREAGEAGLDLGDSGVTLAGGARVEVLERGSEQVRVRSTDGCFDFEGWAPGSALGRVFDDSRFDSDGFAPWLCPKAEGIEILAAPGAAVVGSVRAECAQRPLFRPTGQARDGFLEVVSVEPFLRVRGWVREEAVYTPGFAAGGGRMGGTAGRRPADDTPLVRVPRGTIAYSAREGASFAATLVPMSFELLEPPDEYAWTRIRLSTRWGALEGWILCGGVEPTATPNLLDCVN